MKNKHEFEDSVRKTLALYTEVGPRSGFAMQEIMAAADDYADYRVDQAKAPSLFPEPMTATEVLKAREDLNASYHDEAHKILAPFLAPIIEYVRGIRVDLEGARPQVGR